MNPQVKLKSEDTRARIMDTAETLFRRLGYEKTAVADIASELGMSPANVYRFFPSKIAIVQAICQRCLAELETKVWSIARGRGPASERLQRLVLEMLAYHKENLLEEQKVNDIVIVAMEQSWDAIMAHKEVQRTAIELIVRDGIEAGEFEPGEPRRTAELFMRSCMMFTHPLVIGQCLDDGQNLDVEASASVRFLLRAITPRR